MKELWEVKYRPTTLDDYIFQSDKHKQLVQKFIEEKNIPHLLLVGAKGTGKTSLALLLKHLLSIDDMDFKMINASLAGIDTVRNDIQSFVSTYSLGDFKVVFLDEADRITPDAQKALRSIIEEYSNNARFILSGNESHKFIPPIKSRCSEIIFKPLDNDSMLERLAFILHSEKIKGTVEVLQKIVETSQSDMRKAISLLQLNSKDGTLHSPSEISDDINSYLKIIEDLENDQILNIRNHLTKILDDDWEKLYKFLYEYLHEIGKFKDIKKWRMGTIIIAEHLYKHAFISDPEINAMAMFIKLGDV